MKSWIPSRADVWVAALLTMLVAGAGGSLTQIGPWYFGLAKPSWQPPDWLFGPAWTTIFTLTAIAGVLAWRGAAGRGRWLVAAAIGLNAVLNVVWSALFFFLRRPDWALVEVVVLWLSVVGLTLVTARFNRVAPWLLVPYLLWVGFAGVLNLAIVRLNGPFA
ncbi:MAG: tryptophan-rich sensory protein [Alphaproteobacteria bacterium]|nr:tryptophan-rich sensory protein [Alphaproteobacteria bacterium]